MRIPRIRFYVEYRARDCVGIWNARSKDETRRLLGGLDRRVRVSDDGGGVMDTSGDQQPGRPGAGRILSDARRAYCVAASAADESTRSAAETRTRFPAMCASRARIIAATWFLIGAVPRQPGPDERHYRGG